MSVPAPASGWEAVRSWRREARRRILAARVALPPTLRQGMTAALTERLLPLLEGAESPVSFYWPFRGEPDLRPLMRALAAEGCELALPVVKAAGAPLAFRPWEPGCAMGRGVWDIPIPATDLEVTPRTLIAPLVGFDSELYRLGYGGGFFDRTIAAMKVPVEVIGVGFAMFQLPSIRPQAHDRAMGRIVTERSADLSPARGGSSPVCYADDPDVRRDDVLDAAGLELALRPVAASCPEERRPLLDFIFWRLGVEGNVATKATSADLDSCLAQIIPHVADDGIHASLQALRATLQP